MIPTFALLDAPGITVGGRGIAGAHEAGQLPFLGLIRSFQTALARLIHHVEEGPSRTLDYHKNRQTSNQQL